MTNRLIFVWGVTGMERGSDCRTRSTEEEESEEEEEEERNETWEWSSMLKATSPSGVRLKLEIKTKCT